MRKMSYWKTVDIIRIDGVAYAYQQRHVVDIHKDRHRRSRGDGYGVGLGLGATAVPESEHRLVELPETLNKESKQKVIEAQDL